MDIIKTTDLKPNTEYIGTTEQEMAAVLGNEDYYLAHPPTQPKNDIADYVKENGFDIPKRFDTLKEALGYVNSGGTIIIRSEHPQEYKSSIRWKESICKDIG